MKQRTSRISWLTCSLLVRIAHRAIIHSNATPAARQTNPFATTAIIIIFILNVRFYLRVRFEMGESVFGLRESERVRNDDGFRVPPALVRWDTFRYVHIIFNFTFIICVQQTWCVCVCAVSSSLHAEVLLTKLYHVRYHLKRLPVFALTTVYTECVPDAIVWLVMRVATR